MSFYFSLWSGDRRIGVGVGALNEVSEARDRAVIRISLKMWGQSSTNWGITVSAKNEQGKQV